MNKKKIIRTDSKKSMKIMYIFSVSISGILWIDFVIYLQKKFKEFFLVWI